MTRSIDYAQVGYPSDVKRYDIESRRLKARKIRAILRNHMGSQNLTSFGKCLDVGCGSGIITDHFSEAFDSVIGIDLAAYAVQYGHQHKESDNLTFLVGDVGQLPVPNAAFDVVICAQVYEHVPDPQLLASEIWRILKPGGICFFSGPNRLALVEEHYFLPFLSWFPRPLADAYVRLSKRGNFYDAYPYYLWQIKRLWHRFQQHDYTYELIRRPLDFEMDGQIKRWSWLANMPAFMRNILAHLLPNYNWILVKPPVESQV